MIEQQHQEDTPSLFIIQIIKMCTSFLLLQAFLFPFINSFQAMLPYIGAKKGVLFYGGVSPSKIGIVAPY
jgi:hypothetical protein